MGQLPEYEVYAIRYHRSDRLGRENLIFCPEPIASSSMPLDYSLWAIRGHGRSIVVDTGYSSELARKLGRTFICDPMEALTRIGMAPDTVEEVILTHLHYDHAGNIDRFPKAKFYLHPAELPFANGWYVQEPAFGFVYRAEHIMEATRAVFEKRVQFVPDQTTIAPGIELHMIPGHSPGHLAVRVWTRRGWVLLAVDVAHFYRTITMRRPYPLYLDLQQSFAGYDRLMELQPDLDLIIPGHETSIIERYPAYGPGLEGVVARLDLDPAPAG